VRGARSDTLTPRVQDPPIVLKKGEVHEVRSWGDIRSDRDRIAGHRSAWPGLGSPGLHGVPRNRQWPEVDHLLMRSGDLPGPMVEGEAIGPWQVSAGVPGFDYPASPVQVHADGPDNSSDPMSRTVVAAERSHRGRVRKINEDSVVVSSPIFAVADGMGGHNSGDVASAIVASVLGGLGREGPHTEEGVRGALELANLRISREIPQDETRGSAGTTVVGVMLTEDRNIAFNVGDSRLYMIRRGAMRQLSKDHSVVQELVDMGEIDAVDAPQHKERNVITRAVGIEPVLEIDMWELEPDPGDRYLLASDGLSGELSDDEIAVILGANDDPQGVADELVAAALANGGRDNVTVVVVDVQEEHGDGPKMIEINDVPLDAKSRDTTERKRQRQAIIVAGDFPAGDWE